METPTLQAVLPVARCKMGYLAELEEYDTEKPFFSNVPFFNIPGAKQHNIVTSYHDDVPLTDLRGQEDLVSLDTHGFALRKKDKVYPENLFHDEKWITSHYYEEIGEFVKKELGANRVVIFDHTVSDLLRWLTARSWAPPHQYLPSRRYEELIRICPCTREAVLDAGSRARWPMSVCCYSPG